MKRKSKVRLFIRFVRVSWLKYAFALLAAFVLGVVGHALISYIRLNNVEISEAYAAIGVLETDSTLELTARLDDVLSQGDKQRMILDVAGRLGINAGELPQYTEDEEGSKAELTCKNARSDTSLQLISLNDDLGGTAQRHYLLVRINIKADDALDIIYYRQILREKADELGAEIESDNLILDGCLDGRLTTEEMDKISDDICRRFGGEYVLEDKAEEKYTLYIYTKAIEEYIEAAGEKINVQAVIRYDAAADKTRITVATPIIP